MSDSINCFARPVDKALSVDWKKYGFVIASKYRTKIVLSLLAGPKNPKKLSEETKLYLSHVSFTLKELSKKDIAECLTPGLKRGRIYALTSEGKELAEKIREEYMA